MKEDEGRKEGRKKGGHLVKIVGVGDTQTQPLFSIPSLLVVVATVVVMVVVGMVVVVMAVVMVVVGMVAVATVMVVAKVKRARRVG
jgi:hypothetical protein